MSTAVLDIAILKLRAELAGRQMERALQLGDREAAEGFKVEMYARIAERMELSDKLGECYFTVAGETANA